jgi:hypothetical protein
MAKRDVNAISKGRAAKGKRETIPRTRTTSTGAQQFDRGPETITGLIAGAPWSASMDKKYPGRGYDELEADMAKLDREHRQGMADISEAAHKRKMARNMRGVEGYAMGGEVGGCRGGGAALRGTKFRGVK